MNLRKRSVYIFGLILTDIAAIYFAFFMAYELRFFNDTFINIFPLQKGIAPWSIYQNLLQVMLPLWISIFAFWGKAYQTRFSSFFDEFVAILRCAFLASLFTVLGTFLYRGYEYSRLVMGFGCGFSFIFILSAHEIWKLALNIFLERLTKRETALVAGESKIAERLCKILQRDAHITTLKFSIDQTELILKEIQNNPTVTEVVVDSQVLTNAQVQDQWQTVFNLCEDKTIAIKILPDILETRMGEVVVDESLGIPILRLKPLSLHGWQYATKRIFDLTLCIIILSVFCIPFALISLWIYLDSKGGIFFVQERVGFQEKRFFCFKFRTMRQDAEKVLEEMNLESFRGGPAFKMKGDPRITRAGKILRKFSLDEFPQIINILKGEMSFIGPRPQVLKEAAGNPQWAKKRFRVLPGITGLWQVSGRADLSYEEMMRLDVYYMENWSLGLDLKILLKTVPVVLGSQGAY